MPITKQTVAIVGADSTKGANIAKSICDANYRILLISDDISKVQPMAMDIIQTNKSADIDVMDCQFDACWEADIIVMAVPYNAYKEVAGIIEKVAAQKIVISTANPTNKELHKLETTSVPSAAEELQRLLPNSKIVKAFDTISTADFDRPESGRMKVGVPITGNDKQALKTVSEFVQSAGFKPVVAGQVEA